MDVITSKYFHRQYFRGGYYHKKSQINTVNRCNAFFEVTYKKKKSRYKSFQIVVIVLHFLVVVLSKFCCGYGCCFCYCGYDSAAAVVIGAGDSPFSVSFFRASVKMQIHQRCFPPRCSPLPQLHLTLLPPPPPRGGGHA